MAAPKLQPDQQNQIIEMLAARESYADIARAVDCSPENIRHYAKTYKDKIQKKREEHDAQFIDRGLRTREKRLEELEWLYGLHKDEVLNNGIRYTEKKVSATGLVVEYEVYNSGIITQMRGLHDDIAKELGDRKTKTELTGAGGAPVQLEIDDVTNLTAKQRSERLAALLSQVENRAVSKPE